MVKVGFHAHAKVFVNFNEIILVKLSVPAWLSEYSQPPGTHTL